MTKVLIDQWDGGISLSDRPRTTNEQSTSGGYDIFADVYKLKKIETPDTAETVSGGSLTGAECPVFDATKRASDGRIIGVGQTSSSSSVAFRFWRKNSDMTGYWQQNSAVGNNVVNYNAYAVLYKDVQYGYYMQSAEARLYRYDSDSAMTLIGTTADAHTTICPKPVVHSQDNILYMASNKTVSKFDGTTFTASAITLPYYISSLCEYGTYLAIACQSPEGGVIYLWGRDTSLTTLQDIIKVDNGKLQIVENLDGYLTSVTETPYDPNTGSISIASSLKFITVRMYIGGSMKLIRQTYVGFGEDGSNQLLSHKKAIRNGRLLFTTESNYLFSFGMNKNGVYTLSRDAQSAASGKTTNNLYSFFVLGDYLFNCQRVTSGSPSDGLLYRNNGNYGDTSYYVTTINPSMPINDRNKEKQLQKIAIVIQYTGTITVKFSVDNGSTYSTLISQAGSGTYSRIEANNTDTTGNPVKSGHEFLFKFESTGQVDIISFQYEYEVLNSLIS